MCVLYIYILYCMVEIIKIKKNKKLPSLTSAGKTQFMSLFSLVKSELVAAPVAVFTG